MSNVRTGLDNLLDPGSRLAGLAPGATVGLIAHPASVDSSLRHTVDRILEDRRLRVVRLFAPEHGVRGEAQDMETVTEIEDPRTGLPVVSLYGAEEGSLRPTAESLAGLDAVVYDLQDVGSRYYTFVYTLSYVMETCALAAVPVVVLDRPNPIGGTAVEGPVLEPRLASFVGRYPIAVRHGMTTGELAAMFNQAFGIGADLRVVPMTGWRRRQYFEDTGLPWVAPSPNMPTVETAVLYPGGCLVEGTNLSEGRGTTRPFELVGAPWLDGHALARAMEKERLPGVGFRATAFTPTFHKHAGLLCHGVQVHVFDRRRFPAFLSYLLLIQQARRQDPARFAWRDPPYEYEYVKRPFDILCGTDAVRRAIEGGVSPKRLGAGWRRERAAFGRRRAKHLLY